MGLQNLGFLWLTILESAKIHFEHIFLILKIEQYSCVSDCLCVQVKTSWKQLEWNHILKHKIAKQDHILMQELEVEKLVNPKGSN